MATSNELLAVYILEYQNILAEIALFGNEHPDNAEGYNVLIKIGEQIRLRAEGAGFTALPPLPKLK
jgi:hypothetical protein